MAASSVGSDIFALVALLAISLLVLLLLRHYVPLRSSPAYLTVPVFLALALPSSIVLLVPIDLASATGDDGPQKGIWLPKDVVRVTWRITYWLTFVLTWFVLPILGEYCDSGFRDTRARVMYSLRSNARYQLIVLGSGIAGLVYFILSNGFHGQSIKGMIMALAYAWGLILAIALMGHGMVALPRRLYMNADVGRRLRRLQVLAPKIKDKLDTALDDLEQLEHTVMQLKQRKNGTSLDLQDWIDELVETSTTSNAGPGTRSAIAATNTSIPAVVTDRYMADMTRRLKRARHKRTRFADEWSTLCHKAKETQMIIDAASARKLDFAQDGGGVQRLKLLTPLARFYLHAYAIPYGRILLAASLAVASVILVWSEFAKGFLGGKLSVVGLTVVHSSDVNFTGQLIAAAWLMYMCTCALYAISDVKVWGNRALVARKTYPESATWYSLQVAKLTVPLSYNFITMLPEKVYQETMFYDFLGKLIDLTPLGSGFSMFFPCFLLIPVLATLFNLYGKVKNVVGFGGMLEDESEENPSGFGTGSWREGRALIEREWQSHSSGAANLGLSSRGASLDIEHRSAAPNSGISTPPRGREGEGRQPLLPTSHQDLRTANRQFNAITNQEEEDDSPRHFYDDFTERVRNTFETTDRPEWVKDLGNVFKKPKWMDGNGQNEISSDGGNPFKRFFGGSSSDGQLRL